MSTGKFGYKGPKAKKVAFFKDGDVNFSAVNLTITRNRYRTFETLLNDLNNKVPLPYGVRSIYTPAGRHNVAELDELQDGKQYVCSTHVGKRIRRLDYGHIQKQKPFKIARPRSVKAPIKMADIDEARLFQSVTKPKVIEIFANGDVSKHGKLILNKRTAPSLEVVLQHASDMLQMNTGPVEALFTPEGKRIISLKDLMAGPDTYVATGRYNQGRHGNSLPALPSGINDLISSPPTDSSTSRKKPLRKKPSRPGFQTHRSAPGNLAGGTKQGLTATKRRASQLKDEKKDTEWLITVETSDIPDASCDSNVFFVLYGENGHTDDVFLGKPGSQGYRAGTVNEAEIRVLDVGEIYKVRIWHDNSGNKPSWHVKQVLFTNLQRTEEVLFACGRWLSRVHEDGETVREFPAVRNEEPCFPVVTYEVKVYTGDEIGSGTDSNVYMTMYGEHGDSGKRQLRRSKTSDYSFQRGGVDLFEIEAVYLGDLKKIVIGHDNAGAALGWFLEQVTIKEDDTFVEYTFTCQRWLSEDEEDGKIERVLEPLVLANSDPSPETLWDDVGWKVKKNTEVVIYSKESRKAICCNPNSGSLYCIGEGNSCCRWIIREGQDENVRTLYSKEAQGYLSLDREILRVTKGDPGILNEFHVRIHPDHTMSFESVVHNGLFLGYEPGSSHLMSVEEASYFKFFCVSVQGCMRENGRLSIISRSTNKALFLENNELELSERSDNMENQFTVVKISPEICAFQSDVNKKFIRGVARTVDCKGTWKYDKSCQFQLHHDIFTDEYHFESIKRKGNFLAIAEDGQTVIMTDYKHMNSNFVVRVLKFGSSKGEPPSERTFCEHSSVSSPQTLQVDSHSIPPTARVSPKLPTPPSHSPTKSRSRHSSHSGSARYSVASSGTPEEPMQEIDDKEEIDNKTLEQEEEEDEDRESRPASADSSISSTQSHISSKPPSRASSIDITLDEETDADVGSDNDSRTDVNNNEIESDNENDGDDEGLKEMSDDDEPLSKREDGLQSGAHSTVSTRVESVVSEPNEVSPEPEKEPSEEEVLAEAEEKEQNKEEEKEEIGSEDVKSPAPEGSNEGNTEQQPGISDEEKNDEQKEDISEEPPSNEEENVKPDSPVVPTFLQESDRAPSRARSVLMGSLAVDESQNKRPSSSPMKFAPAPPATSRSSSYRRPQLVGTTSTVPFRGRPATPMERPKSETDASRHGLATPVFTPIPPSEPVAEAIEVDYVEQEEERQASPVESLHDEDDLDELTSIRSSMVDIQDPPFQEEDVETNETETDETLEPSLDDIEASNDQEEEDEQDKQDEGEEESDYESAAADLVNEILKNATESLQSEEQKLLDENEEGTPLAQENEQDNIEENDDDAYVLDDFETDSDPALDTENMNDEEVDAEPNVQDETNTAEAPKEDDGNGEAGIPTDAGDQEDS